MSSNPAARRRPILDVGTPAVAASRGGDSPARPAPRLHPAAGASTCARRRIRKCSREALVRTDPDMTASQSDAFAAAGASDGGGGDDLLAAREADFDILIDRAIAAILEGGNRDDPVFGPYAELNSVVRAVTYHEGKLLEQGLARLIAENPLLSLMPPETALPIVPAAVEMLKRNGWSALKGVRLSSEVHYRKTYTPDLFIVDHFRHSALILDVKRTLGSCPERRLNALRDRMMAAALIAADWLHTDGRVAGVTSVGIAIIDGSSERSDRATGIFALEEIGELIGIPDAGEAILELRAKFALRVQEEMRLACIRAMRSDGGEDGGGSPAAELDEAFDGSDAGDPGADDLVLPSEDDDDEEPSGGGAAMSSACRSEVIAPVRGAVSVGFARGGAP
jgi:hypothetical protein